MVWGLTTIFWGFKNNILGVNYSIKLNIVVG